MLDPSPQWTRPRKSIISLAIDEDYLKQRKLVRPLCHERLSDARVYFPSFLVQIQLPFLRGLVNHETPRWEQPDDGGVNTPFTRSSDMPVHSA
jgi:hypothetical protein